MTSSTALFLKKKISMYCWFNLITALIFLYFFVSRSSDFPANIWITSLILAGTFVLAFILFYFRKILLPDAKAEKVPPVYIIMKDDAYKVKSLHQSSFSMLLLLIYGVFIVTQTTFTIPLSYVGIFLAIYHIFENFFLLLEIPKVIAHHSLKGPERI